MYVKDEEVIVHHQKPWRPGAPIQMRGFVDRFDGVELVLHRNFANPGRRYDGIGAVQERGDHGTIHLRDGAWMCRRRYFRASGELIGELFNIQTATRFSAGHVHYLDLEVDVAWVPSDPAPVQIHDVCDLERALREGHLTPELGRTAFGLASALAERLALWRGKGELDWDIRPDQLPQRPSLQIGAG